MGLFSFTSQSNTFEQAGALSHSSRDKTCNYISKGQPKCNLRYNRAGAKSRKSFLMCLMLFYKHPLEAHVSLSFESTVEPRLPQSPRQFQHHMQMRLEFEKCFSKSQPEGVFSVLAGEAHGKTLVCISTQCSRPAGRLQNAPLGFMSSCDSF